MRVYGMAATSNLYFEDPSLKPVPDATFALDLVDPGVSEEISRYYFSQFGEPNDAALAKQYGAVGELIVDAWELIRDNHPFILIVDRLDDTGTVTARHAVSVYKMVINHTAEEALLFLYDNANPAVEGVGFPDIAVAWTRPGRSGFSYRGYSRATLLHQQELPEGFSLGADVLRPFRRRFLASLWEAGTDFIAHKSPVRMLITDSATGLRVGFLNGTERVAELEGARIVEIPDADGDPGYAFYVPSGRDYQITCYGQSPGTMYLDVISPQSESVAREIVFDDVEVLPGTLASFGYSSGGEGLPPVLEIDLDGDSLPDSIIAASSITRMSPDTTATPLPTFRGDFDGDGAVDFQDFFMFVDVFGQDVPLVDPVFDLDGDGNIGFPDFFRFADAFGLGR